MRFEVMTEAELRQWVEANPGGLNHWDEQGCTPLHAAAYKKKRLELVHWLLDEKGADVNATTSGGWTALHDAASLDILNALLNRGADPTPQDKYGWSPLLWWVYHGSVDVVARLLQDPGVRTTINIQRGDGCMNIRRLHE